MVNSITYQRELKQLGFKSVVINPGIQYPPPSLKSRQSKKIIGYLGRLVSEKGVDYLLHACKLLESDLVLGGWRLEIVGDGPLRNSLEHLAESLFTNSGFTVTFSGYGNNYEALSRFSFLVNPCLARHPLEMVNVESAVMKLPVVCFGNEQIPETVIDGQTGLKSRKQTVAALAEQISKLVRGFDPGWKFDSLVQGFRFENQVKRLASVYTGLLK